MSLDIWNKKGFAMSSIGEKHGIIKKIKHFKKCIKWSYQRVRRGYADCDVWGMRTYLQELFPAMLTQLKESRHGSPGFLGYNEDGSKSTVSCHKKWDEILDRMIFLWNESNEDTCQKINPYEKRHTEAFMEFAKKYGVLGQKLQTKEELKKNKEKGLGTIHFMSEIPYYRELDEKFMEEEVKLDKYREACKDEVMDLMKRYFFDLWD